MEGVNVLPEPRYYVERAVGPIHPEGHDVVVQDQTCHPLVEMRVGLPSRWEVTRQEKVERDLERELAQHRQEVMELDFRQLFTVAAAEVLRRCFEAMLLDTLGSVLGEGKVYCFAICVVEAPHNRSDP